MKRNFPGIKIDLAGDKTLVKSPLTKVGEAVRFALAIRTAKTKMGGFILFQSLDTLVKILI